MGLLSRKPENRALALMSALVLEDGSRWIESAADWQVADAKAVLDPSSSTPYHWHGRCRGAAKTSDGAGYVIAAMLEQLPMGSKLYAVAADQDQAGLVLDSIRGYLERTPLLHGRLRVKANEVTASNGSSLECVASDAASSWGWRPAMLLIDEIAQWPATPGAKAMWEAASSAIAKTSGAMIVMTSAGDPAHWSYQLREHAREDPLWRLSEIPGGPGAPWSDPERIEEQRRRLTESSFARLYENVWTAGDDRLVDPDVLRDQILLDGPQAPAPGIEYVIGLDVGIKHDRTVVTVCHAERDDDRLVIPEGQRVVLDRIAVWTPSRDKPVELAEVAAYIHMTSKLYNGARLIYDPYQAIDLTQRLANAGVRSDEYVFSSQSVGRLAAAMHSALRNRQLALPDDRELLDELANVRLRESSPGLYRMDHDSGRHDDRAISLALCVWKLLSGHTGEKATSVSLFELRREARNPSVTRGDLTLSGRQYLDVDDDGELRPPPGYELESILKRKENQ